MKKRIRILSILAVIICATLAVRPAIEAAAEAVRTQAGITVPESPTGSGSIIAEKTEWSQLQEGDRFYIVIRAGNMAVSLRQKNT